MAVGVVTGCSPQHSTHAVIEVDSPIALADQRVHLTVTGLAAGDQVTVTATAPDYRHQRWRGQATFRADRHGVVRLDRDRALSGTYTGVDGMGLFWSMNPPTGDGDQTSFSPAFPSASRPIPSRSP
jgi:hypothetical protein